MPTLSPFGSELCSLSRTGQYREENEFARMFLPNLHIFSSHFFQEHGSYGMMLPCQSISPSFRTLSTVCTCRIILMDNCENASFFAVLRVPVVSSRCRFEYSFVSLKLMSALIKNPKSQIVLALLRVSLVSLKMSFRLLAGTLGGCFGAHQNRSRSTQGVFSLFREFCCHHWRCSLGSSLHFSSCVVVIFALALF